MPRGCTKPPSRQHPVPETETLLRRPRPRGRAPPGGRRARLDPPDADPGRRHPGRARRPRRHRPRRDRLRQDRRLRACRWSSACASRARHPRPGPLADARDHAPDQGLPRLLRRQRTACAPSPSSAASTSATRWTSSPSGPAIVVATPGRLLDHLERGTVRLDQRRGAGARRSRPHARPRLHAADPAHPRDAAREVATR